jgi:ribonuclease HI
MKAKLYFDGSNDPKLVKPASWGFVLEIEGREPIHGQGICKPNYPQTNNTAEYSGLCHGLMRAKLEGVTDLHVQGDSQLVIYQITGKYKVNRKKNPHLGILNDAAINLTKKFEHFTITWEDQKNNKADAVSRVTKPLDGTLQKSTKGKHGKITHHS